MVIPNESYTEKEAVSFDTAIGMSQDVPLHFGVP